MPAEIKLVIVDDSKPPPGPLPSPSGSSYAGASAGSAAGVSAGSNPFANLGPASPNKREAVRKEQQDDAWQVAKIRGVQAQATNAVQGAGQFGVAAANNSTVGAVGAAANTAATALSALGPKGVALGAALQVGAAGVAAFTGAVNAFATRGRELAGFDPRLAGAAAKADLGRMQSDMREADVLGEKMAKLIELQEKSDASFREIMLPLKAAILDGLNDVVEGGLGLLVEILQAIRDGLDKLGVAEDVIKRMDGTLKRIRDIIDGARDADPIETWIKDLGKFIAPPAPPAVKFGFPVRP